ncbi:RhoGAP domain-containing protein [Podospora appendiculata]|uniref:RhoGAP domain-containing protein n=1 Tax=Podospora appendiculata TaxID=314037 RepID=A0AAE0XFH0_9PEZI|nr:RhoGAP domain-containing protein [Podospora appendiculata]
MTSAAPPPGPHPAASQQRPNPPYSQHPPTPTQMAAAVSPPTKRGDLKSWWKGFKIPSKHQEAHGTAAPSTRSKPLRATSIFVEDLGGLYDEVPSSIARVQELVAAGEEYQAHQASASLSQPPAAALPHTFKLDTVARILAWRFRRYTGGPCPAQDPSRMKLMVADNRPQGIFGVPLRQSITYANVAISLVDEYGKSYIYGYVPIVVAKCGVYLKEKATEVEGIFRLSGSEKRIKELKTIFDSPDRYGKGLVWDGFTVHDAANVLRRYLNDLPEPVVPLDLYEKFREPLRGATRQAVGDIEGPQLVENFDMDDAIVKYQHLITELPPLNRQLLLYLLDLLAVFAAKSDHNRMNSQNLAAIFQPGMLSHPNHAMAPEEYRLNQCVIIFLIENQDHFLIGMQGTAADEKTVLEVQKGTPITNAPSTPVPNRKSGVTRSSSNASAGAASVAKEGQIRRNKSTSSRRSFQSNGGPSPASPAAATTPTGGLGRSNTLPSKKSPALQSGRFASRGDHSSGPVAPLTPVTPSAVALVSPPTVVEEVPTPVEELSAPPVTSSTANTNFQPVQSVRAERSQERLVEYNAETGTPSKGRGLPGLFARSPTGESEARQPNKLRKKKMPGSAQQSAHSSTASLPYSAAASPAAELSNPLETIYSLPRAPDAGLAVEAPAAGATSDSTPKGSSAPSHNALHPFTAETSLRPKKSPPTSLHSSFNEGSDLDQVDEPAALGTAGHESLAERKKRWRLSRRKEEVTPNSNPTINPTSNPTSNPASNPASNPGLPSPRMMLGSNSTAAGSSSSIGSSAYKPRQSMTGEYADAAAYSGNEGVPGNETANKENQNDPNRGIGGWLKTKFREHKETAEQRRNKSPPGDRSVALGANLLAARGKSLDIKRGNASSDDKSPPPVPSQQPQPPPPTQSLQPQMQPQAQVQAQVPTAPLPEETGRAL